MSQKVRTSGHVMFVRGTCNSTRWGVGLQNPHEHEAQSVGSVDLSRLEAPRERTDAGTWGLKRASVAPEAVLRLQLRLQPYRRCRSVHQILANVYISLTCVATNVFFALTRFDKVLPPAPVTVAWT